MVGPDTHTCATYVQHLLATAGAHCALATWRPGDLATWRPGDLLATCGCQWLPVRERGAAPFSWQPLATTGDLATGDHWQPGDILATFTGDLAKQGSVTREGRTRWAVPTGARGVEKGESDMHLYGTKRDRSERVVCCFPLYKLKKNYQRQGP